MLIIISHGGPEGMVIIMAILGISPQGEVTQELRAERRAARAIPRLADEPVALVIIIRVSRRHLEIFGEVEFLNEFVLTSQKVNARSSKNALQPSSASRRKWRILQFKWDKTYPRSTLIEHVHQM